MGRPRVLNKKVVSWRVSHETLAQILQIEVETFRHKSDVIALAVNTLWEMLCESGEVDEDKLTEYVSIIKGVSDDD